MEIASGRLHRSEHARPGPAPADQLGDLQDHMLASALRGGCGNEDRRPRNDAGSMLTNNAIELGMPAAMKAWVAAVAQIESS